MKSRKTKKNNIPQTFHSQVQIKSSLITYNPLNKKVNQLKLKNMRKYLFFYSKIINN